MDTEFVRMLSNIMPKAEEMWDVQENDGLCDVGKSQGLNPITENIDSYRKCWGGYLLRMDRQTISKIDFE